MSRAMRLLLPAALLLTASCDPFYLEADVVDLCQRLPGQRFEVPPEVRARLEQLDPEARRLSSLSSPMRPPRMRPSPTKAPESRERPSHASARVTRAESRARSSSL